MLPKEAYEAKGLQSGYALPRQQFDWLMFYRGQQIVRENGGFVLQGFSVLEVTHETSEDGPKITGVRVKSGGRRGEGDELAYTARVTIGAGVTTAPLPEQWFLISSKNHSEMMSTFAEDIVNIGKELMDLKGMKGRLRFTSSMRFFQDTSGSSLYAMDLLM